MIVVRNLPHLVVEDPLGKLAGEFLLSHEIEGLFHIGNLFRCHIDPMLAKDCDRHVTRVTVKNSKTEGVMKFGIPLRVTSELAQVARTVGHRAFSFKSDCESSDSTA
jgi:hypothetical protein